MNSVVCKIGRNTILATYGLLCNTTLATLGQWAVIPPASILISLLAISSLSQEVEQLIDRKHKKRISFLHSHWLNMIKNSLQNICPDFDSNPMAKEYYENLYCF